MKRIDLQQMVAILANLGVLVGILLLVYELNQNRQMTQAQTRNAISNTLVDLQMMEATDTNLQRISVKMREGEPLTSVETEAFRAQWTAYFRYWENVHYQYRHGLYDQEEYFAQREAWRGLLNQVPGVRDLWCGRSPLNISSQFLDEMRELLGESGCN